MTIDLDPCDEDDMNVRVLRDGVEKALERQRDWGFYVIAHCMGYVCGSATVST
jgi:hypothetical protein